jgi:hypothetical protein
MEDDNLRNVLTKDFFTKTRPHMTEREPKEDMIPMKWKRYKLKNKIKSFFKRKNSKKT